MANVSSSAGDKHTTERVFLCNSRSPLTVDGGALLAAHSSHAVAFVVSSLDPLLWTGVDHKTLKYLAACLASLVHCRCCMLQLLLFYVLLKVFKSREGANPTRASDVSLPIYCE